MNLPLPLQKKDSIIVPMDKVEPLFQWRNNNVELVYSFTPFTEDVVIRVANIFIHVEKSPDPEFSYRFTVYNKEIKLLVQDWNKYSMIGNVNYNRLPTDIVKGDEAAKDYAQSVISLYCTLMAYAEHYKEVITKKEISVRKTKDRKKRGGKGKKVTYLRNVVYTVSGDVKTDKETLTISEDKRGYTYPSEPFKVRGHWRHYKNGNSVWIESYTKNEQEGKEPDPKIYKI